MTGENGKTHDLRRPETTLFTKFGKWSADGNGGVGGGHSQRDFIIRVIVVITVIWGTGVGQMWTLDNGQLPGFGTIAF